jgi:hypothetical protein
MSKVSAEGVDIIVKRSTDSILSAVPIYIRTETGLCHHIYEDKALLSKQCCVIRHWNEPGLWFPSQERISGAENVPIGIPTERGANIPCTKSIIANDTERKLDHMCRGQVQIRSAGGCTFIPSLFVIA